MYEEKKKIKKKRKFLIKIKNQKVVIIHGMGKGIIRKITQETLRKNKLVEEYKIDNFNPGMTVVTIKKP